MDAYSSRFDGLEMCLPGNVFSRAKLYSNKIMQQMDYIY